MTQIQQVRAVTYTPGEPERNDPTIVRRLAVTVQANAIEAGDDMSYDDAYRRADENLAYVRAWAAKGRRPV